MADAYLLETGTDRVLLEDGTSLLLLETGAAPTIPRLTLLRVGCWAGLGILLDWMLIG